MKIHVVGVKLESGMLKSQGQRGVRRYLCHTIRVFVSNRANLWLNSGSLTRPYVIAMWIMVIVL